MKVKLSAQCVCPKAIQEHGENGCVEPEFTVHIGCPECGQPWKRFITDKNLMVLRTYEEFRKEIARQWTAEGTEFDVLDLDMTASVGNWMNWNVRQFLVGGNGELPYAVTASIADHCGPLALVEIARQYDDALPLYCSTVDGREIPMGFPDPAEAPKIFPLYKAVWTGKNSGESQPDISLARATAEGWKAAKAGAKTVTIQKDCRGTDHPENAGKFFLYHIIK